MLGSTSRSGRLVKYTEKGAAYCKAMAEGKLRSELKQWSQMYVSSLLAAAGTSDVDDLKQIQERAETAQEQVNMQYESLDDVVKASLEKYVDGFKTECAQLVNLVQQRTEEVEEKQIALKAQQSAVQRVEDAMRSQQEAEEKQRQAEEKQKQAAEAH